MNLIRKTYDIKINLLRTENRLAQNGKSFG